MNFIIKTARRWYDDDPFTLSASVAYYAVFSLPGLLIVVMAVASLAFERQEVENAVLGHIRALLGDNIARGMDGIVHETQQDGRDFWAFIIGILTLLFGATGLFAQIQKALNIIWEVEVRANASLWNFLRTRATSLGIVVSLGFLLLISLLATALLSILNEWLMIQLPHFFVYVFYLLDIGMSFVVGLFIFTMIFKILPDANIGWRPAIAGGTVSTLLFLLGEYAITFYFETVEPASAFGAAGSIILLMLWASYSCLLLLFGAQFGKTYSEYIKERATPSPIARKTR